ncbi:MAG TPA: hypothetical protein VNF46_05025 [Gammaproteobacteria bacterium]|nr:hypothetical protein [Gammaproteobacteria bacterium]
MEFDTWRFNLRSSSTEHLLRLNLESRGDAKIARRQTRDILHLHDQMQLKKSGHVRGQFYRHFAGIRAVALRGHRAGAGVPICLSAGESG